MEKISDRIKSSWQPLLIFLLLSLSIIVVGWFYSFYHIQDHRKDVFHNLESVASLKENQINNWLNERLSDAQNIIENPYIGERVARLFEDSSLSQFSLDRLRWMKSLQNVKQYQNVILLDINGHMKMQTRKTVHRIGPETMAKVRNVVAAKQISLSDFYYCTECRTVHLDVFAPIIHYVGTSESVVGVIILRIEPEQLLYPLIQQWPVPSRSAETYLVKKERDNILYLTELKFIKGSAAITELPLSRNNLPEVMAINGSSGILAGVDYRNHKVFAMVHDIPHTSWLIVAKIDRLEAEATAYIHVWLIGIIVIILIIAAGGIIAFLWNRQQKSYFRRQYQLEKERQALSKHYEYLAKYANDIILMLDENLNIREANDKAVHAYGYPREELLAMDVFRLRYSDSRSVIDDQYRKVVDENGLLFETAHKRSDGSSFQAEVSARMINIEGQKYFQAIIRDITERKHTQEILNQQKNELEAANQELLTINRKLESSQEELRISATRWEATFDSIGDGLSILDSEFNILQCNIQFTNMVKKSFGQIIGQKIYQIIHGSSQPLPDCPIIKMRKSQKRESTEYEDGGRWFVKTADPVFNSRQQLIGAVHILSDITEKKIAQEKIKGSLKEKEVLLREIHHRVKNNLQVISSLLNLQSGYINDKKSLTLFRECQTRVRSMALIHEKLYQSKSLSSISFAAYAQTLAEDLFQTYGINQEKISYSINIDEVPMKVDTAIPCGLIVNELISNSLKHGFPNFDKTGRKGLIEIGLARESDGNLALRVSDNGVGLPKGFDIKKVESLGLHLVDTLVQQLDGRLEIKNGKGACFRIVFQVK